MNGEFHKRSNVRNARTKLIVKSSHLIVSFETIHVAKKYANFKFLAASRARKIVVASRAFYQTCEFCGSSAFIINMSAKPRNAFEVLGKSRKPQLTSCMESAIKKYPQWKERITGMGKNAAYRKKSYREIEDVLRNENYARSGLSSLKESVTSVVELIKSKVIKIRDFSISLKEQKAFLESTESRITTIKNRMDVLAFGGQMYVKTHRGVKKFIGLLQLKGLYIEANDLEQYQIENDNLASLIALKDCLSVELERIISYVVKRGEIHRQCNLDLQDKSVAVRANARKKRDLKLASLLPPESVYFPLVNILLSVSELSEKEPQSNSVGEEQIQEQEGEEKPDVEELEEWEPTEVEEPEPVNREEPEPEQTVQEEQEQVEKKEPEQVERKEPEQEEPVQMEQEEGEQEVQEKEKQRPQHVKSYSTANEIWGVINI